MELTEFWISIKDEYLLLRDKAQQILINIWASYDCCKKMNENKNHRGMKGGVCV